MQSTMNQLLDNITWYTLTGPHAVYAAGTQDARRYAAGFSPILGFADPARPDFDALVAWCEPGEQLYCPEWKGEAPAGWRIHLEKSLFRMVWEEAMPDADEFADATRLGPEHADQALELAQLTNPGPFGPRTIELGEYFGWFEHGRLAAMAGERMYAGTLREVSGICTHPDFRGRGLARRLTLKLVRREMQRGETPFLHVMGDNPAARRLYHKMGFRDYCETTLRVISRV
jgi:ribosomal protein S18 acetylase RimI-like enzyme